MFLQAVTYFKITFPGKVTIKVMVEREQILVFEQSPYLLVRAE